MTRHLRTLGLLLASSALIACMPDTTGVNTPVAIRFLDHPADTRANTALATVTVGFINRDGAVTRNSPGGLVEMTLVTSDTSVHLVGITAADGAYGVATFYALQVDKAATGLRLVARSAGFDSTVSNTFAITP